MGRGQAVTSRRCPGQEGWQDLAAQRPEDVSTRPEGHVRLLHAARALRSEVLGREEDQAPIIPQLLAQG